MCKYGAETSVLHTHSSERTKSIANMFYPKQGFGSLRTGNAIAQCCTVQQYCAMLIHVALSHQCRSRRCLILLSLDRVLVKISEQHVMVYFKVAPLANRRDITMLSVIHRVVLSESTPQLRHLLGRSTALRRSARHTRHGRQSTFILEAHHWT